jgi:hypothetical protein
LSDKEVVLRALARDGQAPTKLLHSQSTQQQPAASADLSAPSAAATNDTVPGDHRCLEVLQGYWTYQWCSHEAVHQFRRAPSTTRVDAVVSLGTYQPPGAPGMAVDGGEGAADDVGGADEDDPSQSKRVSADAAGEGKVDDTQEEAVGDRSAAQGSDERALQEMRVQQQRRRQRHSDESSGRADHLGYVEHFVNGTYCENAKANRSATVIFQCCVDTPSPATKRKKHEPEGKFANMRLQSVKEPFTCVYQVRICVPDLCELKQARQAILTEAGETAAAASAAADDQVVADTPPLLSRPSPRNTDELQTSRRVSFLAACASPRNEHAAPATWTEFVEYCELASVLHGRSSAGELVGDAAATAPAVAASVRRFEELHAVFHDCTAAGAADAGTGGDSPPRDHLHHVPQLSCWAWLLAEPHQPRRRHATMTSPPASRRTLPPRPSTILPAPELPKLLD